MTKKLPEWARRHPPSLVVMTCLVLAAAGVVESDAVFWALIGVAGALAALLAVSAVKAGTKRR